MEIPTKLMTVEAFDAWMQTLNSSDPDFEYIGGEVVEVVSRFTNSELAGTIFFFIKLYLRDNKIGRATVTDGGYQVGNERYIPDVGFISDAKITPEGLEAVYYPAPPDLAVEVVSPSDTQPQLTIKVMNYVAAGTVVWVVRPESQSVEVYVPQQTVKVLRMGDSIDGGTVLPNFHLDLKDIFEG